ncbi:5' nucleotidase, NT5C type [Leuconostoc rapi]|uniref:5' nucleotidase, NT5C type n=1 Tax=Leuconostoc rapi TaxID=1406906 RepID=UPI00195D5139|nr:hypothetical protein [Leuconostoc rapi]MBM7435517.1 hypothetical protein [Leuconostoc rapi]
MLTKPKLFLDMDNVLVDTLTILNHIDMTNQTVEKPDQIPGIFRNLPPMSGAVEAIKDLSGIYELHILSTAPWKNASAWQDKISWLAQYFGDGASSPFYKRVTLTHDKGLAHGVGGILIDDRPYHGASDWQDASTDSLWLQYGYDPKLVWSKDLVSYLKLVGQAYQTSGELRNSAEQVAQQAGYQLFSHDSSFEKADWE